jgi:hypothetical protein
MKHPSTGYKKRNGLGSVYNIDTQGLKVPILVFFGVIVLGGVSYIGYRALRKGRANQVYDRAFDDGTPEAFAQRLKTAMGGSYDGTDEAEIIKVFSEIPNQAEYEKIEKAFQKLTQRNLNEALEDELSAYYLDKLRVIKNTKAQDSKSLVPDNAKEIARMLKEGVEGTTFATTNIELVFDAFKLIPDRPTYLKVKTAYKEITGNDLWEDLRNEWDLTASWTGFMDYFSNPYAGQGGTYLELLEKETKDRFSEL